jgi:predicted kinase
MAAAAGARCVFVLCTCREQEVRRRLALRARDPRAVSDGRWEIYLLQREGFELPDAAESADTLCLDTEQEIGVLLAGLGTELGL